MQVPEKKNKKPVKHLRGVLLAVLSLTLLAVGGALWLVTRPAEKPPQAADTAAQLVLRDAAQVASITVSAPQGENYTLLYEGGSLWYQGETPFPVDDVLAVADCLANHVDCELVLGVRNLHGDTIPVKSLVGNGVINACLALFCGLHVSDSQTGLRGISTELMARCLDLPGDRFEFEMQMLLACTGTIEEVPIRTIYEEEGPHMTHFAPLRDSWAVVKAVLAWKLQGRSRRASR